MDGKPFFTYQNEHSGYDSWPFDHPFYLLLNIAVGGNWGGQKGVDESIWPLTMEVDYVRVYQ
jgi:beta-glucanase (GH16 family)